MCRNVEVKEGHLFRRLGCSVKRRGLICTSCMLRDSADVHRREKLSSTRSAKNNEGEKNRIPGSDTTNQILQRHGKLALWQEERKTQYKPSF